MKHLLWLFAFIMALSDTGVRAQIHADGVGSAEHDGAEQTKNPDHSLKLSLPEAQATLGNILLTQKMPMFGGAEFAPSTMSWNFAYGEFKAAALTVLKKKTGQLTKADLDNLDKEINWESLQSQRVPFNGQPQSAAWMMQTFFNQLRGDENIPKGSADQEWSDAWRRLGPHYVQQPASYGTLR